MNDPRPGQDSPDRLQRLRASIVADSVAAQRRARRIVRRALSLAGNGLILAGLLLVLMLTNDGLKNTVPPRPAFDETAFLAGPDVAPTEPDPPPLPTSTAVPTPPPSTAPIARLQIARLGIDASVVTLGVDADGTMQSPKTPIDVGWYRFSPQPGTGGNAVFAAHVDYINYGPAVFYRLGSLAEGDEVRVRLTDDTVYAYRVVFARMYSAADAPLEEIVGPTGSDSVTLITCGGTFNYRTREYDKRVVVRAERVRA